MTSVGTITNPTNTSWEEFIVDYEAPTSDTYYFAINITSTGAPWYLGFDEFSVTESPDCFAPLNLTASDITNNSVNLSWNAESTASDGYEWVIMPQGVAADISTAVATATTSALSENVTGLDANTNYSAYVRSECGPGEVSDWSSAVNFTTLCDPVSDFSEDFNFIGTGNMPDCWNTIIQTGSTFSSIGVSSFEDFTLPNAVRMSNGFTTSGDMIAVSPPLSTLGDGTYWLKLDAVTTNASNNLIIGTLSDPNDAATFTPLETLDLSTSLQSFEVLFTSYTGSDNFIGFKRELTTTSNSVYFDNVVWEVAPTCFPPTNLSVSNITSNSVDLSWDAEATASDGYEWVIMPQGVAADISTAVATATTSALSENVTGLDANTNYSVYVRSECDPGEFSTWSDAVNFTTDCGAFALNFEEDFSDFGLNINTTLASECWAEGTGFFDTVANGGWGQQNFVNQASHPNGRSLYINLYNSTPRQDWVTTPAINLGSGSPDYVLSYDVYAAPWNNPATAQLTSFGNHSVEVYISTDFGNTWTDLLTTYDDSNNPNDINDTEEVFSLASYTGEIKIGFLAHQDGTDVDIRFYIDNLFVGTPPTCFPPDITSSFGTATEISTDWPVEATATDGYNWFLMAAGENPLDDTPLQSGSVATNALTVSDLTPNTAYDIYVQSNCGGGNLSTFTVLSRTTPALEASPWTEGFDGASNPIGWNITGWTRGNGTPTGGGGVIEGRDGSNVIRRNLWSSAPNGFIETVNVGPIQAGDYLSYEYNIRNYGTQAPNPVPDGACTFTVTGSFSTSGSVILQSFSNDDKLGWQKKYIDLSDYVGETVQISMLASWNTGDFWIYFDNFAIKNVDGYVYADDVQGLLTGTPVGVSTDTDAIEVVEGNATFGGNVEADELVVFAQASLDIEDVLDLDGELYTDGEVTFKSNLAKTGQLASASQVRGQVTTERFVPAGTNASRGFRFITPTVDGGSIFNNWQEGGTSPAGFGTHITGSTTGANGFDATATGNPSLFVFDNEAPTQAGGVAWVPASNTNANLVAGTPYRIFVRGDRSIDLTEANPTPNNTVLRAKGNLVVGNRTTATFASDDLQFSFIGNPYQAIVNLNNVTFNGDVNPNYAYV